MKTFLDIIRDFITLSLYKFTNSYMDQKTTFQFYFNFILIFLILYIFKFGKYVHFKEIEQFFGIDKNIHECMVGLTNS